MNNEHLIPEIILNLVAQYKVAKHENEVYSLQLRLEAIRDYCDQGLIYVYNKKNLAPSQKINWKKSNTYKNG
jgi:hypothetical protein